MTLVLNGKEVAGHIENETKNQIDDLNIFNKILLAVIQIGNDKASSIYIKNKRNACHRVGIAIEEYHLSENITESELINIINELNNSNDISGILVQLPLPKHINESNVINSIRAEKDVDGLTSENVGNLWLNNGMLIPCTPFGIVKMLKYYDIDLQGKHCVVVGRSNIVGKPMSALMLSENCTVTMCHSHTKSLKEICRSADILICSVGIPKMFTKDYIKNGSVVIDVGINRMQDGTLCGDADYDNIKDCVYAITPVPGGVGKVTVSQLISNCLTAYKIQHNIT